MKPRLFYSTRNAAKAIGVSLRTVARLSERYNVEPHRFEGQAHSMHIWTRDQLKEMKRHLRFKSA